MIQEDFCTKLQSDSIVASNGHRLQPSIRIHTSALHTSHRLALPHSLLNI